MTADTTSAAGRAGEARAVALLRELGYRIVTRNFRCRAGEIDIVARDRDTLVFVEVRTRRSDRHGDAIATVGKRKQTRLARVASAYLALLQPRYDTCRFDVIGITGGQVRHIKDAFRIGL